MCSIGEYLSMLADAIRTKGRPRDRHNEETPGSGERYCCDAALILPVLADKNRLAQCCGSGDQNNRKYQTGGSNVHRYPPELNLRNNLSEMTPKIGKRVDFQQPSVLSIAQMLMLQYPGVRVRHQHRVQARL